MSDDGLIPGFKASSLVADALDIRHRLPFRGFHVLGVQHVHSSIAPLLDALHLGGARMEDVTLVGKSYSSRAESVAEVRDRGISFIDPQRMTDPRVSFEIELSERVSRALEQIAGTAERLLVLDEGAVAARELFTRPELAPLASRSRIVEQTTRGARWIDTAQARCPVVDVARSAAKAGMEGPLVADAMMRGLDAALGDAGLRPGSAGVVGYGRMGQRIAQVLSARADVIIYDFDASRTRAAKAAGLAVTTSIEAMLSQVELLVGCTGHAIIGEAELDIIDRSLALVNCASSDIEYSLWGRRVEDAILPGSVSDRYRPWLNHYGIDGKRPHILLSGGFPINFYHKVPELSPQQFDVTRSMMLAGAVQVLADGQRATQVPLAREIQDLVAASFAVSL